MNPVIIGVIIILAAIDTLTVLNNAFITIFGAFIDAIPNTTCLKLDNSIEVSSTNSFNNESPNCNCINI